MSAILCLHELKKGTDEQLLSEFNQTGSIKLFIVKYSISFLIFLLSTEPRNERDILKSFIIIVDVFASP